MEASDSMVTLERFRRASQVILSLGRRKNMKIYRGLEREDWTSVRCGKLERNFHTKRYETRRG